MNTVFGVFEEYSDYECGCTTLRQLFREEEDAETFRQLCHDETLEGVKFDEAISAFDFSGTDIPDQLDKILESRDKFFLEHPHALAFADSIIEWNFVIKPLTLS